MNGFLRRLTNLDRLSAVIGIAKSQQAVIDEQRQIIVLQQQEILRMKIEYSLWGRDIITQFLIALDRPADEDELRQHLSAALIDMADEAARLEEFSR